MRRAKPCYFNEAGLLIAGCYESRTYGIHHCTCDNAPHKRCVEILDRLEHIEYLLKIQKKGKGKAEETEV